MKELITTIDNFPKILKLILALPGLDIVWGIYRILLALDANNTTALIIAIVLCFIPFMWIIDLVLLILNGSVWSYKG